MRLIIIIFFLQSIFVDAQTIRFVDVSNNPVKDVYLEFSLNGIDEKYSSNSEGVILIKNEINSIINVKISHVKYQKLNSYIGKNDTVFVLNEKNIFIDEVVITAQIKPTKLSETVQKVKVISRTDIDNQAANNLKDLLDKEMNMRLSYDNVLGSSVSIQGVSGQNVKILIDGVPVIGRLNGNIDLSQINLNNIAKVEIIEGPLSVDFGTDALAGTINLITNQDTENIFSSLCNLYYESVGNYNTDLSLSYNLKSHFLALDIGRKYFDGWSENEEFTLFPRSELADTNRVKSWNPKEQYFGKIQYKFIKNQNSYRMYYDIYDEKITNLGFPRLPYFETAFDDYYYTKRNNFGFDINYNLSDFKKIKILSSFNDYKRIKNTYFKDLTTLEEILTNSTSDQDTSEFKLLMNKVVFSSFSNELINYQVGFDSKVELAKGQRINNKQRSLGDHAIFLTSKWTPTNYFSIKPAFRFSYNSKFNVTIIPSINLIYKENNYTLRFSYARGFRSPSLKELFFEFVDINHNIIGNKNLDSENSDNFQLNVDFLSKFSNYKFEYGTKLFYNNINNLISLAQSPGSDEYTYFNLGKYKTRGISTKFKFKSSNIDALLAYSNVGRYNDLSEESEIISFSHSSSLNSNISYTLKQYYTTLSIFYNYTGKLPVFYKNSNQEIIESEVASYQLFDLIARKTFLSGKINFSIGLKNIFDVQDISSFSASSVHSSSSNNQSVAYGRSFFTSLNFKL